MRRFLVLTAWAFPALVLAQAAAPLRANCPSCNLVDATLTLSGVFTSNVASGSDAIQLKQGAKLNLNNDYSSPGTTYVKDDGFGSLQLFGRAGVAIDSGSSATYANVNEHLEVDHNATNHVDILGASTGNPVAISAAGGDAAISLTITPKGSTGYLKSAGLTWLGTGTNGPSSTYPISLSQPTIATAANGTVVFTATNNVDSDLSLTPVASNRFRLGSTSAGRWFTLASDNAVDVVTIKGGHAMVGTTTDNGADMLQVNGSVTAGINSTKTISLAGGASAATVSSTGGLTLQSGSGFNVTLSPQGSGGAVYGTATIASGSTGAFSLVTLSAMSAATNYGGYQMGGTIGPNTALGTVTCTTLTTAGSGTAGTLAIYDVTGSSVLCSGTFTCTTAKDVAAAVFNCNSTPVSNHMYAMRLTTGCGATNPTGLQCNVEITH